MEPQNNQTTQPTATAPAPQAPAPAPAPAPVAEAPVAPVVPTAAPAKSGSKLPMWLVVLFVLVVAGGAAYFLMSS